MSRPTAQSPRPSRSRPSRASSRCPASASPARRTDEAPRRSSDRRAGTLRPGGRRRLQGRALGHAERVGDAAERRAAEHAGLDLVPGHAAPAARVRRDAHVRPAVHALAAQRHALRRAVAGARGDQQDRVELRHEHGAELRGRDRLDAVHALHLGALGRRRRRRRDREPLEPRRRDRRGGPLPGRFRRRQRHLARGLLVQPRPVVRRRGAAAGAVVRHRRPRRDLQRRPTAGVVRTEHAGGRGREAAARPRRADAARAQPPRERAEPARGLGLIALRPARARPARGSLQRSRPGRAGTRDPAAGRADECPAAARVRPRPGPRGLVLAAERRLDRSARLQRPVRLPGRRRPLDRLGLAPPPRLPGRRHRRAGRLARSTPSPMRPSSTPGRPQTAAAGSG